MFEPLSYAYIMKAELPSFRRCVGHSSLSFNDDVILLLLSFGGSDTSYNWRLPRLSEWTCTVDAECRL